MTANYTLQNNAILQKLFRIFIIISLIFCITLIPLLIYLQKTFTDLQYEHYNRQLNVGTTQLETTITGILNLSQTLAEDPRFITLRYEESDYTSVPANIRLQLTNTFHGLFFPLEAVSYAALLLDENIAVTPHDSFFQGHNRYYPNSFCADGLSYDEWYTLLKENAFDFLPVQHVRIEKAEYDAIIYSARWTNSAYIFACLNISDIKRLLFSEADLTGCYITIARADGTLLYTDLPENKTDYETISQKLSAGKLQFSIHISDAVFSQKMQPLYIFLTIYCMVYFLILIAMMVIGIYLSSRPLLKFLRSTDLRMEQFQNTIDIQRKILHANFLEKAIYGQLSNPQEIEQFLSHFPDFPESYCLMLVRLQSCTEDSQELYPDPLLLLYTYLQQELPQAYIQQLDNTRLFILTSEKDFENYRKKLDFVIENINKEEPSLIIQCAANGACRGLENLPAAYRQLCDIELLPFSGKYSRVYMAQDCLEPTESPVSMTELLSLHTAITYGNRSMALQFLQAYSEKLKILNNDALNKSVYEMIHTILKCIRLEHPRLFLEIPVSTYNQQIYDSQHSFDLYACFSDSVGSFSDHINTQKEQTEKTPLVTELLAYIDDNYTNPELCLTFLETQFKHSSSHIRKVFKNETGITISSYIEQRRMELANKLLAQNAGTVADIALKCGFSNANSFYKAYRRVHGYSPSPLTSDTSNHD